MKKMFCQAIIIVWSLLVICVQCSGMLEILSPESDLKLKDFYHSAIPKELGF